MPNLAKDRPAFASSLADASGPDRAFDDDLRTSWQADTGHTPHWLEVQFDAPTTIDTIALVETRGLDGHTDASRIRSYQIEAMSGTQ